MDKESWLSGHGWGAQPVDVCWLDCDRPGHLKTFHGREIILCFGHAQVLEAGKFGGSYAGAPLPPGTMATRWPWQPAEPVPLPV